MDTLYEGDRKIYMTYGHIVCSPRPLERLAIVSARPGYHGEAAPVGCQQPPGAGADAVALQDIQAPGPFQSIVRFSQVQEDHVEDLLPHGCKLSNIMVFTKGNEIPGDRKIYMTYGHIV